MRSTLTCIAAALACIPSAGCTVGLAKMNVQVFPGGHGSIVYAGIHPKDVQTGAEVDSKKVFRGVVLMTEIKAEARIVAGHFPSLDMLNIGDIQFSYEDIKAGSRVRVTIPVSKSARWYQELGFTESEARDAVRIRDFLKSRGNEDPFEVPLTFTIEINLPGRLEAYRLTPSAEDLGWSLDYNFDEASKFSVTIPTETLAEQSGVTAGLTIECGPASESARVEGERIRALLPE
jgi:hypothetical protein